MMLLGDPWAYMATEEEEPEYLLYSVFSQTSQENAIEIYITSILTCIRILKN